MSLWCQTLFAVQSCDRVLCCVTPTDTTTETATVNANSTSATIASQYNLSTGKQLEGFYHETAIEGVDLVTEISRHLPTAGSVRNVPHLDLDACFSAFCQHERNGGESSNQFDSCCYWLHHLWYKMWCQTGFPHWTCFIYFSCRMIVRSLDLEGISIILSSLFNTSMRANTFEFRVEFWVHFQDLVAHWENTPINNKLLLSSKSL